MGILNYWKCVLPEGDEEPPLQRIIDQGAILATEQFSEWRFESDGEDPVTFFDPLYAMNKAGYKTGVDHNFTLGALSLNLKPAAQELVRIEHPETSAQLREIAAAYWTALCSGGNNPSRYEQRENSSRS